MQGYSASPHHHRIVPPPGIKSVSRDATLNAMPLNRLQVIPAENLIAAFHSSKAQLVARANSASSAELMLDALEIGVQGVVLDTEDPSEVMHTHLRL